MATITRAVGRGATNPILADVQLVQQLLNKHRPPPLAKIPENGVVGPETITAIEEFQARVVKMSRPDGRVDPGGGTIRALSSGSVAQASPFNHIGKGFKERVTAFLADAKATHGVTIPQKAEFRKAEDAQKWHIAHMIVFNSFASRKPTQSETYNGHQVIAWSHLGNAATTWQHVSWEDYLRDKNGAVPVKNGNAWDAGHTPDKDQTRKQALKILKDGGIATADDRTTEAHSAMVAPGYDGCAQPCGCGGNRSKHIAGMASDLGKTELAQLEQKLQLAKAGTLDAYLKQFGLHRPMKSESWHVEATTP